MSYLYKHKNGIYRIAYKENGILKRITTGCRTKSEANNFYRNFNPDKIKNGDVRISDMKRKALEYAGFNTGAKTQSAYRLCLSRFEAYLQNDKLANISATDIQNYIGSRNGNKYSMNIEIAILKKSFKIACDKKWITDNPCRDVKKFKTKSPVEYFTPGIKETFLNELKQCGNINYYYAVVIAFETGLRKAEICSLKWDQVNNGRIKLKNKIDGETEYAYYGKDTAEILNILKAGKVQSINEYIFGNPLNQRNLTRTFNRVRDKLGLSKYIRFHSTRHTAITHWANTLPFHLAQNLARHRTPVMTSKYIHTIDEQLREAVNK